MADMKREDLGYTYSADGYMLTYKGHNIGGAGVRLPREKRLSPTQRKGNLNDFRESAERAIAALVDGRGEARFLKAITEIEAKN